METVNDGSVRQNGNQVMFKTTASATRSVGGKLVGYGPKGVVTKQGLSYYVYGANGQKIESFPESQWSEKKWSYSDYCR